MKRYLAAALAAALLCAPLGGCVTPAAGSTQAQTPAQTAQRAMLTAETAFNIAATAELDAKAMGLIKPANVEPADAIRKQAYQTLVGLRQVYAAGATPNAAGLLLLTNQLLILAGKAPVPVLNVPTL